ncbi:MAG TPA: superoxide dismutase family protein [Bacillota bacterium]
MVLKGSRVLRVVILAVVVIVLGALVRGVFPGLTALPGDGAEGEPDDARDSGQGGFVAGSLRIDDVPVAAAMLEGGPLAPQIHGEVLFFGADSGSTVAIRVNGLPEYVPGNEDTPPVGPHGFHIHEFGSCEAGDPQDPFLAAGDHWNPTGRPHGDHAGDFPVIFSNLGPEGFALMTFFTDEFQPLDVVGRSVLIHLHPNDYRTQPAGASGPRLACGVIEPIGSPR